MYLKLVTVQFHNCFVRAGFVSIRVYITNSVAGDLKGVNGKSQGTQTHDTFYIPFVRRDLRQSRATESDVFIIYVGQIRKIYEGTFLRQKEKYQKVFIFVRYRNEYVFITTRLFTNSTCHVCISNNLQIKVKNVKKD